MPFGNWPGHSQSNVQEHPEVVIRVDLVDRECVCSLCLGQ